MYNIVLKDIAQFKSIKPGVNFNNLNLLMLIRFRKKYQLWINRRLSNMFGKAKICRLNNKKQIELHHSDAFLFFISFTGFSEFFVAWKYSSEMLVKNRFWLHIHDEWMKDVNIFLKKC